MVCTLARTRDTVAVLVIQQLYTRLNDGMTPALALRDALGAVRCLTWRQVVEARRRLNYAPPRELSLAPKIRG